LFLAKRPKSQYVCSNCGQATASWSGRCPSCGEWNTLQEQLNPATVAGSVSQGRKLEAQTIGKSVSKDQRRLKTGLAEVDDVFGGGIVAGSVNLIAGQPGIGKSTLLLQLAYAVAGKHSVLYASGEESEHQVGLNTSW
jgi:DNA repair protein RadA/Sms